jgi:hypothetical protein
MGGGDGTLRYADEPGCWEQGPVLIWLGTGRGKSPWNLGARHHKTKWKILGFKVP